MKTRQGYSLVDSSVQFNDMLLLDRGCGMQGTSLGTSSRRLSSLRSISALLSRWAPTSLSVRTLMCCNYS